MQEHSRHEHQNVCKNQRAASFKNKKINRTFSLRSRVGESFTLGNKQPVFLVISFISSMHLIEGSQPGIADFKMEVQNTELMLCILIFLYVLGEVISWLLLQIELDILIYWKDSGADTEGGLNKV